MLSPTSFYSGCLYFPKYLSLFSNFPFHQVALYETADIWSFLAYKKIAVSYNEIYTIYTIYNIYNIQYTNTHTIHNIQIHNIWNSGTERENESYSSIHVTLRHSTNVYSAQSKTPILVELQQQSVQDSYMDLCNPFYPLSPFNPLAPQKTTIIMI